MPEQLRIAMLSVHSCPLGKLGSRDTGGMNVYIKELSRELGKRGHHVDIYTRAHEPVHQQVIELGNNVRLIHIGIGSDDDIPKLAIYAYLQGFICGVENFRKSSDVDYDLLHSHYWLSGLIGNQLKLWWHVPHLCMFHTLAITKNNIGIGEDEPELRIESERQVIQDCDCIIAATETEKKELIKHYDANPDKIDIIPCGVNVELFRPIDKKYARQQLGLDHESMVLFVGRVEPLKGLRQMLKALPLIASRKPFRLMIVGGDENSRDEMVILQQLSVELNIQDRVTFGGSVTQEKLPLFYSAADVCIIPS
ncbi:MAG: glycosyltransferase family 1 protein, partial [Chloroflexi bacterium]|nr:glycosyltransferase family 1 protein [Chloroflexota bacterium]